MNRDQKAAAIAEIAESIQQADAVFAVDYRGLSVPQAAELRARLRAADARFAVGKIEEQGLIGQGAAEPAAPAEPAASAPAETASEPAAEPVAESAEDADAGAGGEDPDAEPASTPGPDQPDQAEGEDAPAETE